MTRNNFGEDHQENFGFDLLFLKRFYRLHRLLFLSFCSLSSNLFGFLLITSVLEEYIVYQVGVIPSRYYKVLGDKDLDGFYNQTLIALGIILAITFTKSTKQFIQKVLSVTWRQLLCRALHRLYFSDIHYYMLNVIDKSIDNPDQRMTQDIDKFTAVYCEVLPKIMVAPFTIAYYTYLTYEASGWQGPLCCFGFFILGTTINKLIMSPIVKYVVKMERREGDFRFIHMNVRVHSESIAFHEASHVECVRTNKYLDKLINTQYRLYIRQYFLTFSVNLFDYLGSILSYLILAVPIFSGSYDNITPTDLSSIISRNSFVTLYLIFSFTTLMTISEKVTDVAGVSHRIAQLIERLNFINTNDAITDLNYDCHKDKDHFTKDKKSSQPLFTLNNVSFSTPRSNDILIKNLSMSINQGESLLISGPSSAGKTSFIRVLRGLWSHNGIIEKFFQPGPTGIYYCPQKPYLTIGTLREQISFPLNPSENETDTNIMSYFELLNLTSLVDRVGGLDEPISWSLYDSLSPGEMQRLCAIRVFHHRPVIAVLDEATSALPVEMEEIIYSEYQKLQITLISIAHRTNLRKFHKKSLEIENGNWRLTDI